MSVALTVVPSIVAPETVDVATKLAPLILPVTLNVPATFTPVPVITTTFALPAELILTLPFDAGIETLLLPFANMPTKLAPTVHYAILLDIPTAFAKI